MKQKKRGFTIVELVIVIAVIAILAAVLIPTFSNIIRKSQISADVQLCRNLNTVLANAEAEGRIPSSVYDVLYLENEAGYVIANLNPTADDMYYAWDSTENKIVYLMSDLVTAYYPEDYTVVPENCYITVGSAAEAQVIANKGYNLALEKDINETITLSNVVSIDTLGFTASDVVFSGVDSGTIRTAYLVGNFGEVSGNIQGASVVQSGSANVISVSGASAAKVTVNGSVSTYSASVTNSTISAKGTVSNVASGVSVTNNGIIKNSVSGANITNNGTVNNANGASVSGSNKAVSFTASSKEDLENLRYQVMAGGETFKDRTVELEGNINLNNISFCPISSFYRKNAAGDMTVDYAESNFFQGVFDGKGYTIENFSNVGFSISGLTASTNSTSASFGADVFNESIYGLFASVSNATIKNITINCAIDMVKSTEDKMVGDCVGGLVGFSYGDLTIENVTVNGSVKGYDGVGGIVGRCYGKNATVSLKNVTNNANVTGARHTGGIIGYVSGPTIKFDNVKNNGNVENLGWKYDKEVLGCTSVSEKNAAGYYIAAAAYTGGTESTIAPAGFTQNANAKVIIAGKETNLVTGSTVTGWTDKAGY